MNVSSLSVGEFFVGAAMIRLHRQQEVEMAVREGLRRVAHHLMVPEDIVASGAWNGGIGRNTVIHHVLDAWREQHG